MGVTHKRGPPKFKPFNLLSRQNFQNGQLYEEKIKFAKIWRY